MWTCESIRPGMAVVPPASITTSHASISCAAAVPTETMRPSSQTMLSPSTNGARQSPEQMVPMLVMATRMVQPAILWGDIGLSVRSRESGNPVLDTKAFCAGSPLSRGRTEKDCASNMTLKLFFRLQRQAHRVAGRDRALDRDGRLQVHARLLGRGVDSGRAGRQMIEPGAGLVAERSP